MRIKFGKNGKFIRISCCTYLLKQGGIYGSWSWSNPDIDINKKENKNLPSAESVFCDMFSGHIRTVPASLQATCKMAQKITLTRLQPLWSSTAAGRPSLSPLTLMNPIQPILTPCTTAKHGNKRKLGASNCRDVICKSTNRARYGSGPNPTRLFYIQIFGGHSARNDHDDDECFLALNWTPKAVKLLSEEIKFFRSGASNSGRFEHGRSVIWWTITTLHNRMLVFFSEVQFISRQRIGTCQNCSRRGLDW
jgi:hypothetical protein